MENAVRKEMVKGVCGGEGRREEEAVYPLLCPLRVYFRPLPQGHLSRDLLKSTAGVRKLKMKCRIEKHVG